MAFALDNFVRSTLSADAAAADVTLTLAAAAEPYRDPPAATAGAPGLLVLQDTPASPTKIEVISYTGRSIVGNVVTLTGVTRGLEGSTPSTWTAGTPTFQGITAAVIAQKLDAGGTAAKADQLATARTIAGVPFDGTANIAIPFSGIGTKPTTLAGYGITDAATSAQGVLATGALQRVGGIVTGGVALQTPNDANYYNVLQIGPDDANKDFYCAVQNGAIKWIHNGWYGTGSISWLLPGGNMGLDYYGNLTVTGNVKASSFMLSDGNTLTPGAGYMVLSGWMRAPRIEVSTADSTTWVRVPRIFVQSNDPGPASGDDDLWFW